MRGRLQSKGDPFHDGGCIPYAVFYVEDLPEKIKELQKKSIKTYAAHLRGENAYDEEDYTTGCAFLIGNEGNGLTDATAGQADCLIRIPMKGQLESLNAGVAAAILMYEASRQRRKEYK